jgi:divalent metal cation (Fe/Co/Zn/Cd) transporter
MSLGRAHVISDTIQAAIEEAYPQAEVILHIDPRDDSGTNATNAQTA